MSTSDFDSDAPASPSGSAGSAPSPSVSALRAPIPGAERAAFEREVSGPPYERDIRRFPDNGTSAWPGSYRDINVDLAWHMWQAARAAPPATPRLTDEEIEAGAYAYYSAWKPGNPRHWDDFFAAGVRFAERCATDRYPKGGDPSGLRGEAIEPGPKDAP